MSAADARALREHARQILDAALAAVHATAATRDALALEGTRLRLGPASDRDGAREIDLAGVRRVWLLGAGKAATQMARGALEVLGPRVAGGTLVTVPGHAEPLPAGAMLEVWEAAHPLPDARGLAAASEALRLARAAAADDLVLCLLSGGASALWSAPAAGVSLGELQQVTDALLRAGAPIGELNAVRKHLSRIGGGQLARAAHPARLATLAVSDVIGSPPDVIGSGPTAPDPTTFADALEVLRRRGVEPPAVLRRLQSGAAGELPDTPGPADPVWEHASYHVVADNRRALEAAARAAERLGYRAEVVSDRLQGEAREAAQPVARRLLDAAAEASPVALLWGGETTVTVRGSGRGGRNQELALAAALRLADRDGLVLASLGTDGRDGPTPAAGALVDGATTARALRAGCDPADALARNDSHRALAAAGDLLHTGPTGTNVADLVVGLSAAEPRGRQAAGDRRG